MNALSVYRSLYEVQLLDEKVLRHLKKIADHQKRLEDLQKEKLKKLSLKDQHENTLKEKRKEQAQKEKVLADISSRLEKTKNHSASLKTEAEFKASEREIQSLTPQRDTLENEVLELMEVTENLEGEIKTIEGFLTGLEKTLSTIGGEVEAQIEKEKKEISHYEQRQEALIQDLPSPYQEEFVRLQAKHRFHHPLAFVVNEACGQCFLGLTKKDCNAIELGQSLITCPNCGRMLIPHSVTSSLQSYDL